MVGNEPELLLHPPLVFLLSFLHHILHVLLFLHNLICLQMYFECIADVGVDDSLVDLHHFGTI